MPQPIPSSSNAKRSAVRSTICTQDQTMSWLWTLAICAAWLALPRLSSAASFPCQKASTAVERTICASKEISELDEYLGRYYAAARSQMSHANECLASNQRGWLRGVRDTCKDAVCLKAAYLQRLAELDGVQPGATALKNLQLPPTPTLVGILPPAKDETAAPPSSHLKPLAVQGRLVSEVAGGDGYVLVGKDGRKHLLVPLMLLDESTDALQTLSQETAVTFLVRGQSGAGTSGKEDFAQNKCRYIYRVPQ